jgi:MFS transporter, MHS family, proline/betaine transporter
MQALHGTRGVSSPTSPYQCDGSHNTLVDARNDTSTLQPAQQSALHTVLAGLIGNVLEWFDFAVFGYFASDIGSQFMPESSIVAQKLLAFGVFAIGFLARPLGGITLGMVGDRIGRRSLLTLSIGLMGSATLAIGLLPTYHQIGIAAPLLLVLMRLIQGFSLGGEFTGSMVYTTEQASPLLRGLVSSSTAVGTTIGFILGSISAWLVNQFFNPAFISLWGWRLPFIGSILFCVLGWLLRRGISETAEGLKAASSRPPLWPSLAADRLPMLRTLGIVGMTNAAYYLTFTFVVDLRKGLAVSGEGSSFLLANTLSLTAVLVCKPLGGWLSDVVGRRRMMIGITAAVMVLVVASWRLMINGGTEDFIIGQVMMAFPIGMALGLQGAMVVEIFPLRTRVTSMSFAYSVTLALAGGSAPLVSTWLIKASGNNMAPAFYIIAYGLLGLAIMLPMKETNARSLDE